MTYTKDNTKFLPIPNNPRFLNLTGQIFTRLTVIGLIERGNRNRPIWLCQCACGNVSKVPTSQLTTKKTQSCGCLRAIPYAKTHGLSGTPIYEIWLAMRDRCNNPNNGAYPRYGGRGIKVCERWSNYPAFLHDMGERPDGYSIERRDNNGNYCPENCEWASDETQRGNKSTTHFVTMDGKTQSLKIWCNQLHLNYSTIRARLRRGWTDADALLTKTAQPRIP